MLETLQSSLNSYQEREAQKKLDLQTTRQTLRETLLTGSILGSEGNLVFQADFDGYGDSGQVHANTKNKSVDAFLETCVDVYVTFDWYNNDGGGGDITWDVIADKITINGYSNETVQHDQMSEEEF